MENSNQLGNNATIGAMVIAYLLTTVVCGLFWNYFVAVAFNVSKLGFGNIFALSAGVFWYVLLVTILHNVRKA